MGQHNALGNPCRPGGVNDVQRVVVICRVGGKLLLNRIDLFQIHKILTLFYPQCKP